MAVEREDENVNYKEHAFGINS